MNLNRAQQRDRKKQRKINGHTEDGRSVFKIQEEQKKRAERLRIERKEKERLREETS